LYDMDVKGRQRTTWKLEWIYLFFIIIIIVRTWSRFMIGHESQSP
jgi:hypothetical protein